MTRTKNKALALLLSLAMVFTMMPMMGQTAYADDYKAYDLYVGGRQVTSDNCSDVLGDGTVKFTPATGDQVATLTLDNAEIELEELENGTDATGIYAGYSAHGSDLYVGNLEIVLKGKNRIVIPKDRVLESDVVGICAHGEPRGNRSIKILADKYGDSLTMELTGSQSGMVRGIYFTDIPQLNVDAELRMDIDSLGYAYGIYTGGGVQLGGRGVSMDLKAPYATGIVHEEGNLALSTSLTIDLNKGKSEVYTDYNTGIQSQTGSLVIGGGHAKISSGDGKNNYGVTGAELYLRDGSLFIDMGAAENDSYGLYGAGQVSVSSSFLKGGGYVEIIGHKKAVDATTSFPGALLERGVRVNENPTRKDSHAWDGQEDLAPFKYFRVPDKTHTLTLHWSSVDGEDIPGQPPVVLEDVPAGMSIRKALAREGLTLETVFQKDGYWTWEGLDLLNVPLTTYESYAAYTAAMKEGGVIVDPDTGISDSMEVYVPMFKAVEKSVSITVKPPVCGTKTEIALDPATNDWDIWTQTNRPEYSIPAGAAYEPCPTNMSPTFPMTYWIDKTGGELAPFIGPFKGGESYAFVVTPMAKWGHYFPENISFRVNGKAPEFATNLEGLILVGMSEIEAVHAWDGGKLTKAATENATGIKTYRCTHCGETKTETIPKWTDPAKQYGSDGTPVGPGASAEAADKAITKTTSDKDIKGSKFAPLKLKSSTQGKKNIKLSWSKNKKAVKYVVYGNLCNGKGKKYKPVKLATVKGASYNVKKIKKSKLKKGNYYKFVVVALDKNNKVVSTSKMIHVATKGGKVGNHKSVSIKAKVNKKGKKIKSYKALSSTVLKKDKSLKLKVTASPASKKRKVKQHVGLRYESSNAKVATVSGGKITAKGSGTCYIYVYTQNGASKAIKVTVK